MKERCPTCGQPIPSASRPLTERQLDVLIAWWKRGSVVEAARDVGIGQQRAKNLLAAARIRSGVQTNDHLVTVHLDAIRLRESHNDGRTEAA